MIFFLQDIVIMISFVAVSLQERLVWEPTKWKAVVKQGIKFFLYLEEWTFFIELNYIPSQITISYFIEFEKIL